MPHYEAHFRPWRRKAISLLEIGVFEGASLRVWERYFRRGQIVGLDIADKRHFSGGRVRVHQGDQTDAGLLKRLSEQVGGFDIVIDDGSHMNAHVLASFLALFPLLRDGGLYVVEDLQTSYWRHFGGNWTDLNSGKTGVSFLKDRVDGLNCHWIPGREPDVWDWSIESLCFYPKIAFIRKGHNERKMRPNEIQKMAESLQNGV